METRLDGVLSVARAIGKEQPVGRQFLLTSARMTFLNGDFVAVDGEHPGKGAAGGSKSLAAQSKAGAAVAASDERQSGANMAIEEEDPSTRADEAGSLSSSKASESRAEDLDSILSAGHAAASDIISGAATAGHLECSSSVGTRDEDAASILAEIYNDDVAARKRNYLAIADLNDDRSTEALLVHVSGCLVVSSTIERIAAAFVSGGLWANAIAVMRAKASGERREEWLVTGFAVGTQSEDGSRSTLWRGKKLAPDCDPGIAIEWFTLPQLELLEPELSVCLKVPEGWKTQVFFGQFPEQDKDDMDDEDYEDEDYDSSPQFVLTVPANLSSTVPTLITFELLNDVNYIDGTRLDVYAVGGEEYEACDDPRVFWTEEFLISSCSPACFSSSLTGVQLDLDADMVYMVVPCCTLSLQFCLRVASQYPLQIEDFHEVDESSDDSDRETGMY